ncbi:MAG TPA: hypothetical protein VIB38_04785 [Aestuariivirgaceae bacterium]|jgi:hypothetical protein
MFTIIACFVAFAALWLVLHLLVQLAVGFLVSPLISGRAVLKQKLKEKGADASLIPDAAYGELVERALQAAKSFSELPRYRHEHWRSMFLRLLNLEAQEIADLMKGAPGSIASDLTKTTLLRYGVL